MTSSRCADWWQQCRQTSPQTPPPPSSRLHAGWQEQTQMRARIACRGSRPVLFSCCVCFQWASRGRGRSGRGWRVGARMGLKPRAHAPAAPSRLLVPASPLAGLPPDSAPASPRVARARRDPRFLRCKVLDACCVACHGMHGVQRAVPPARRGLHVSPSFPSPNLRPSRRLLATAGRGGCPTTACLHSCCIDLHVPESPGCLGRRATACDL